MPEVRACGEARAVALMTPRIFLTDLLCLTSIRYDPATTPAVVRQINEKPRKAIDAEGRISRLEGDWWQWGRPGRPTARCPRAEALRAIRAQISRLRWSAS